MLLHRISTALVGAGKHILIVDEEGQGVVLHAGQIEGTSE